MQRKWRKMGLGDEMAGEMIRDDMTPARKPTFEADVAVPFFQAVMSGLAIGTAAAALWAYLGTVNFLDVLPVTVSCALALAWLWRLGAINDTLWKIERFIGADIDGDGSKGKPKAPATAAPHLTLVNPYRGKAAQAAERDEQYRAELRDFVTGCAQPGGTSFRRWEQKLGRQKYTEFRDALVAAGYAAWRNEQDQRAGWGLTADAETVLAGLFAEPGTPRKKARNST